MKDDRKLMTTPKYKGPDPAFIYPKRAEVKWTMRNGKVVLEYPKNFSRFERALHRVLGGPESIKRPMDEVGSILWKMSDGSHSLLEIFLKEQEAFHERVEPVDKVVGGFLETLLKLGLMTLEYRPDGKGRTGKRIIVREAKRKGR